MTSESKTQQDKPKSVAPPQKGSATLESEYKVGPGCPPKQYQFKKGQSGNPKGARRKAPSLAPDLKKLLEQALHRTITTTQGSTLTLFTAGIEQLVRQYAKGDRHARRELFALSQQVGLDLLGIQKTAIEEALTENHQAILYDYVAKQYDRVAKRPPVLAPPELLDDVSDDQNRGHHHG